jgi:multiple sugar transport system ATP-binding protein
MSELQIQGLVKRFGKNTVVDNIDFQVKEGEFFVLLGPSGGGKSTTLRMIAGLEEPDAGRIVLGNQDITRMTPRQRNLGMVFQDYGLYPGMDVFGNVAYGLEARKVPRPEVDKRVRQAAEMLGLTPHLSRSINELSGGEQQRVALARILAKDAELFLFDEPLSNLDPKLRYQARRDILKVHRTKGKPSLYVTHDQQEAFATADRIAVIASGKLRQVGTPDDLIHAPQNVFMARFIGTPPMNIIPATLIQQDLNYMVQFAGIELPLSLQWNDLLKNYRQQQILLGLAPNAIVPSWELERLDVVPLQLSAEILGLEQLIGELIVTLQIGDDTILKALFQEPEELQIQEGETITIGLNQTALQIFDPQTEQALR